MITNDIPNGTILVASGTLEAILVIKLTTSANWGYNLKYNTCWALPTDIWGGSWTAPVSYKHIYKAKLMLRALFITKQMDNLNYIEALAKVKEYEKEKA